MNSKMYVPDHSQWFKYFQKKPAENLIVDNSTIKLTSPVVSVVQRAKTELERINSDTDAKPIIMTPTVKNSRSKPKDSLKHKRNRKVGSIRKNRGKKNKNKRTKIKHTYSRNKFTARNEIKSQPNSHKTATTKTFLVNNVCVEQRCFS